MWNEQKRDDCCDLYVQVATTAISKVKTAALRDPLTTALATAKEQSKRRGAIVMRKALDTFLLDSQDVRFPESVITFLTYAAYVCVHVT